ncbi:MAG: hypothetical protein MUQ41_05590, partial [Loktanella sp.]|nr:hypothetical protein [Loktanella sp.]
LEVVNQSKVNRQGFCGDFLSIGPASSGRNAESKFRLVFLRQSRAETFNNGISFERGFWQRKTGDFKNVSKRGFWDMP